MSKNALNHFLSLLLSGNIGNLILKYFDENVKLILNQGLKTRNKISGEGFLKENLEGKQVLQFKVFDVEQKKNKLSYGVYMVTRNKDNTIDFSEHHIINKWKNDRIQLHNHTIIND